MPGETQKEETPTGETLEGGCQCGAVRYEVCAAPLALYACHCTDCQRQSSSAFGLSMPVPRAALVVTGTTATYTRVNAAGRTVDRHFCPACGTRLYHAPSRNPAIVNLKPGTLDDARWLRPVAHVWTRSAQDGSMLPPDALHYAGQPENFEAIHDAWAQRGPNFA